MKDGEIKVPEVRVCRQNSMNILKQIAEMAGKGCEIVVISYSVTDGWLRQLQHLCNVMEVSKTTLILDHDVMVRHREKLIQIQNSVDECYLTDSHAKMYFAKGKERTIAVITSANATNNYRNECYYATDRPEEIRSIEDDIRRILESSANIA